MKMRWFRKTEELCSWIGPGCAGLVLAFRLIFPGVFSGMRDLLVDDRGEELTREVFDSFVGEEGAVPVDAVSTAALPISNRAPG